MGVTATQAAEIARRHGLSLQDAAGLVSLADTVEEAEELAASFSTPEGETRRFVRSLFKDEPEPAGRIIANLSSRRIEGTS